MTQIAFNLNGQSVTVEAEPEKPLLWVLREDLGLTGAKYGCGMAICGCCVVHLNGDAIRSCVTPVSRAEGKLGLMIDPAPMTLNNSRSHCHLCSSNDYEDFVKFLAGHDFHGRSSLNVYKPFNNSPSDSKL